MRHLFISIYLLVASVVGLIGAVVGYGTLAYSYAISSIITDEEYLTGGSGRWQVENCENDPRPIIDGEEREARTEEEIEECKEEARETVLIQRQFSTKETMLSGGIWGTIFLLLFLVHFPVFIREQRQK